MPVLTDLAARGLRVGAGLTPDEASATTSFVLDTLACCVTATAHPMAAPLRQALATRTEDAPPGLSEQVALLSTLAHLDEVDAFHSGAAVLPCATVVPVALALAARIPMSGPRLLAAVAAGAEVIIEAGLRFGAPGLYERGWWPSALFGGLGAAMTASVLLDHDGRTATRALGLAAAGMGGFLSADELAAGHYRLMGRAAVDGLEAAYAAGAGLTASSTLLDGPASAAFGTAPGPASPASPPHLLGATVKCYPCARPLHAVIEALTALREQGHDPARAERIRIAVPTATLRFVTADRNPVGAAEAAASAACVVSAVLAGRATEPAFFRAALPADGPPIELGGDAELDAAYPRQWGARVELLGAVPAQVLVKEARGGPARPWSAAELAAKVLLLVEPEWGAAEAEKWLAQGRALPTAAAGVRDWAEVTIRRLISAPLTPA